MYRDNEMPHITRVAKKDAELTLRLESEVLQQLAMIATQKDISTSALIRRVLRVWLDNHELHSTTGNLDV